AIVAPDPAADEAAMEPRDYGPVPYTPLNDRPILKWPNGARLAVWIIPNIEFFPLTRGIAGSPYSSDAPAPSVRAWAQRDYGNRVGIWRIMEVLQKHKIRASPTLNSDICDHHPQIVRAAVELGWEILGHNETNSRWLNQMEPGGWLGAGLAETWNTLDHLIEEGCLYVADWVNDDQPYFMDVGGKRLVSIPYSYEINDSPFIQTRAGHIDQFVAAIKRQFDTL